MATDLRRRDGSDLTRADPFAELNMLASQLQSFFGGDMPALAGEGFIPMADIEETEDAYVVELELPGVKKHDINVEISGRRIVVTGERKEKERTGIIRRRTRTVGRFHYEVVLPGDIDESAVDANIDHGVLTLRIPKADAERRNRITVDDQPSE